MSVNSVSSVNTNTTNQKKVKDNISPKVMAFGVASAGVLAPTLEYFFTNDEVKAAKKKMMEYRLSDRFCKNEGTTLEQLDPKLKAAYEKALKTIRTEKIGALKLGIVGIALVLGGAFAVNAYRDNKRKQQSL